MAAVTAERDALQAEKATTLVELRSMLTALGDRVTAIESALQVPPTKRGQIKPSSFKAIGGWRLPNPSGWYSGLGFSRGGLYMEHDSGAARRLWISNRDVAAHQLTLDSSSPGTWDVASWPEAKHETSFQVSRQVAGDFQTYAVTRPNLGGPLLSTGRNFYATQRHQQFGPWMDWVDPPIAGPLAVPAEVDDKRAFGGGFCTIPKWFADKYLDGRDFGVGFGGYRSGQGSTAGPSLFVTHRPNNYDSELQDPITLIKFGGLGSEPSVREQRPPDYGTPLWAPPVTGGIGYWQADEVVAGPVWIDTPQVSGLCYWALQGTGDINYDLQSTCFVTPDRLRCRLYVYSPEKLAAVATGQVSPSAIRGDYYEWPNYFGGLAADRWPIGTHWDSVDGVLYLALNAASGQEYETTPAIVAYQLAG